jgi:transposase-like protein
MPMASHERLIPEPVESKTPQRRRFTAEYKLRILREVEQCTKHGQIVALLRRERLYFSHLSTWRKQRDEAIVAGVMPKRRGRKPKARDSLSVENKRLQRENRRLMAKLRQTETAIGVAEDTSSEDERSPQVIH